MLDLPTPAKHVLDPDSGLWVPRRRGLCTISSGIAGAAAMQGARRSRAAAWLPSDITGVAEWWRADLGVTDAGGGAVSAWQGQIAGETLTQGTAAARPTLTTRDSQSVLSLDGGDYLQGAFGTITLSQPYTVIAVAELASGASFQFIVDGDDVTNRAILGRNGTNQWRFFAGAELTGPAIDTSPHAFSALANGGSSALYVDDLTSAVASGAGGTAVLDGLTLGSNYLGNAAFWAGFIWEVILVDQAITSGDLALLGAYLDARYTGLSLTY